MLLPNLNPFTATDKMSVQELLIHAQLCDTAERFDDMANTMKQLAETTPQLSDQERDLLSDAYMLSINTRRTAYVKIIGRQIEETNSNNYVGIAATSTLRNNIEEEVKMICNDVLSLMDLLAMKKESSVKNQVFYLRMRADYKRYLAELTVPGTREAIEAEGNVEQAYQEAYSLAKQNGLPATSSVWLVLVNNYASFRYEIMGDSEKACQLVTEAVQNATPQLSNVGNNRAHVEAILGVMGQTSEAVCSQK